MKGGEEESTKREGREEERREGREPGGASQQWKQTNNKGLGGGACRGCIEGRKAGGRGITMTIEIRPAGAGEAQWPTEGKSGWGTQTVKEGKVRGGQG